MNTKQPSTRTGEVTLRTVTPNDAAAVRALRLEALTNHLTVFSRTPAEIDLVDWTEQAANGSGSGDQAIFVAEHNGELVAMAGIVRNTGIKTRHSAFIWGVYVKPAARGARVAEMLIHACVNWARGKGLTIIRLTVMVGNETAISCYQRCGFEITGREVAALHWEGVDYDEHLMSRPV